MRSESDYLPFEAGTLPAGSWLILAPHPDDETFGMGGAIALARQRGLSVAVVVLTDGALGGAGADLVPLRESEARDAAARLGGVDLTFWRLPDRELKPTRTLIERLADLIRTGAYSAVFFPMPGEPHPDHRAAAVLAWEALRLTGFAARPWGYEISVQGLATTLLDISEVVSAKADAIRAYASQQSENAYLDRVLGLNAARAWSLPTGVSHAEAFYEWPCENRPLIDLWAEGVLPRTLPESVGEPPPTVSVLIRTCDRPGFLREAIRSVAAQTYPHVELIVVNDGGDDVAELVSQTATGAIRGYRYHRFVATQGRAAAGNQALQMATGEFLTFLDDDDWFAPGHISGLLVELRGKPEAIAAYSTVLAVRMEGEHWKVERQFGSSMDRTRLAYENFIPIHAVLFRRDVLGRGCCFPPLDVYEDWAFWLQVGNQGPMFHVDQKTAYYRIAEGSGFALQSGGADHLNGRLLPFLRWAHWQWADDQLLAVAVRACETEKKVHEADVLRALQSEGTEEIARLHDELESVKHRLREEEEARAELGRLRARYLALEESMNAVLASNSWRVTAVLRLVRRLFQRIHARR